MYWSCCATAGMATANKTARTAPSNAAAGRRRRVVMRAMALPWGLGITWRVRNALPRRGVRGSTAGSVPEGPLQGGQPLGQEAPQAGFGLRAVLPTIRVEDEHRRVVS